MLHFWLADGHKENLMEEFVWGTPTFNVFIQEIFQTKLFLKSVTVIFSLVSWLLHLPPWVFVCQPLRDRPIYSLLPGSIPACFFTLDSLIKLIEKKSGQELLMKGIRLRITIHLCQPIRLRAEGQLRHTTSLLGCSVRIIGAWHGTIHSLSMLL